jgi:UDP-N-acetylmuramoylalanine--D-glutamate ligase
MEYVCTKNGAMYYNDSKATNPESAIKAVQSMDRPTLLIGGGRGKDADYNSWIQNFAGVVRKFYITGEASDILEKACLEQNFYSFEKYKSFEDAVKAAIREAKDGETVLLSPACASYDMFKDYEERGNIFKKIVNEA